jgi:VanZ family protein
VISRCDCAGFRLMLGLALVITTWLSLAPEPAPLPGVSHADKWAHLAAYVVLAYLVDASWPERPFDPSKWLALMLYGLAIEMVQSQLPQRMFSVADLLANAAGIAFYAVLLRRWLAATGLR